MIPLLVGVTGNMVVMLMKGVMTAVTASLSLKACTSQLLAHASLLLILI